MAPDDRLAQLEAEIEKLKTAAKTREPMCDEYPCKVTAVIPAYGAIRTLPQVLFKLERGAQSVPLKVFVCYNVPDQDGLGAWLEACNGNSSGWPARSFREFRVFEPVPSHGNREKNVEHAYAKMLCQVETPFVLFVDADVAPPSGIVADMIEALDSEPELGIIGAQYDFTATHVKMGCSMMRTEVAKEIRWRSKGCVCFWLNDEELPRRGLKARHLKEKFARHLKYEL